MGGDGQDAQVLTSVDGPIGTITLNRPERLNAFVGAMREEIAAALEALGDRTDVRVVVITGAGRGFCAGADVGYLAELIETDRADEVRELVEGGRRVVTAITQMPKPVIASLNGPAAGGGANLALACDLRIASDRAAIGQTFNRIGLHPDWGGTWFTPHLVGPARAAEIFFFADMVDARDAERMGLVNRVVPHDELEAETRAWAERLAHKPALSLKLAKQAIHMTTGGASLDEMLEWEARAQAACLASSDAREGTRAFVEKRPPRFEGAPEPQAATGRASGR